MIKKTIAYLAKRKLATFLVIVVCAGAGYYGYQKIQPAAPTTRYILSTVARGNVVASVSGSGQISVSNQIDLKPKASGDIISIKVQSGQKVGTSTLIAQIDSRDAQNTVRDARTALQTANLEYNKLVAPSDEITIFQAENAVTTAKKNLEDLINPSQTTLTQAKNSLLSAQDSLTKLKFSQETSYQNAQKAIQDAQRNLQDNYEEAFNTIANAFLDLPTLSTNLYNLLYGYTISNTQPSVSYNQNFLVLQDSMVYEDAERNILGDLANKAKNSYTTAKAQYDKNFSTYKEMSRSSDHQAIENLLNELITNVKSMSETAKNETNLLDYWVDYRTRKNLSIFGQVTTYQSSLGTYTSTINKNLTNLLSIQKSIESNKTSIVSAQRSFDELKQNQPLDLASSVRSVQEKQDALDKLIKPEQNDIEAAQLTVKEKELALKNLKAGADALDIRAKKITIQQKQEALTTALQNLADYSVYTPFEGTIATVDAKKSDSVSAGTKIASLITNQRLAEISLNEVDAAKIKIGQKVTLTFDAIESLSLTGQVAEIDSLGTVTQGVVTYNVKITFDAQDDRIKPGMSVSASIITDVKQDVLVVSNSAIKSDGNQNYVESPDEQIANGENSSGVYLTKLPRQISVKIGLANDQSTEILSGLAEGDTIISQTVNLTAAAQTTSTSLFGGGSSQRMMTPR